jgi:hypothetical protein
VPPSVPPTDEERIRKGLIFLSIADRRAIKAAVRLEKLAGVSDPPEPSDVLGWFLFEVADTQPGETKEFGGRMTQAQFEFLKGHQGSLKEFADNLAKVIVSLDHAVVQALNDLSQGLNAVDVPVHVSAKVDDTDGGVVDPPLGSCDYDDHLKAFDVTQDTCEGGLQGSWSQNPGVSKPPDSDGQQKKARTKRRSSVR